jgi:hypothetical protein
MENVEFKKKGLLYFLHKILYRKNPDNTCAYKKQLIFSFIASLLTIHIVIFRLLLWARLGTYDREHHGIRVHSFFGLIAMLLFIVGFAGIESSQIVNDFINWHELSLIQIYLHSFIPILFGTVVMGLVGGIVGLLVWMIYTIVTKISTFVHTYTININLFNNDEGLPNTQIGVLYQGAKERWCKKITWKQ